MIKIILRIIFYKQVTNCAGASSGRSLCPRLGTGRERAGPREREREREREKERKRESERARESARERARERESIERFIDCVRLPEGLEGSLWRERAGHS